jgi:hypothetical protein
MREFEKEGLTRLEKRHLEILFERVTKLEAKLKELMMNKFETTQDETQEDLFFKIIVTYKDGSTDTYWSPRASINSALSGVVGILSNDEIVAVTCQDVRNTDNVS